MNQDNDTPFEKLDLDSLFNVQQWFEDAVVAKGARVTGAGIGVKGDLGMADIDVLIDGYLFNLEITPRPVATSTNQSPPLVRGSHNFGEADPSVMSDSGGGEPAFKIDIVAALVALAEHGIPPDTQELLVAGNPDRGIAPGALRKALHAAASTVSSTHSRTAED